MRKPQFQNVAGTEVMHRHHRADLCSLGCDRAQPDQVGVIELIYRNRREARPRHKQLHPCEPLGSAAVEDAAHPRNKMTLTRAQRLNHEACCSVLAFERRIILQRHGIGGKV